MISPSSARSAMPKLRLKRVVVVDPRATGAPRIPARPVFSHFVSVDVNEASSSSTTSTTTTTTTTDASSSSPTSAFTQWATTSTSSSSFRSRSTLSSPVSNSPRTGAGPTLRDILPHRAPLDIPASWTRLASTGVGLGITFNSRDVGPLLPPPAPRIAQLSALANVGVSACARSQAEDQPKTAENKVLGSMATSSLYMRRRTGGGRPTPRLAPLQASASNHAQPLASPTMSPVLNAILGRSDSNSNSANEDIVQRARLADVPMTPRARLGLGFSSLSTESSSTVSSPLAYSFEESATRSYEVSEWEGIPPVWKSCKDRVSTPYDGPRSTSQADAEATAFF